MTPSDLTAAAAALASDHPGDYGADLAVAWLAGRQGVALPPTPGGARGQAMALVHRAATGTLAVTDLVGVSLEVIDRAAPALCRVAPEDLASAPEPTCWMRADLLGPALLRARSDRLQPWAEALPAGVARVAGLGGICIAADDDGLEVPWAEQAWLDASRGPLDRRADTLAQVISVRRAARSDAEGTYEALWRLEFDRGVNEVVDAIIAVGARLRDPAAVREFVDDSRGPLHLAYRLEGLAEGPMPPRAPLEGLVGSVSEPDTIGERALYLACRTHATDLVEDLLERAVFAPSRIARVTGPALRRLSLERPGDASQALSVVVAGLSPEWRAVVGARVGLGGTGPWWDACSPGPP